MRVGVHYDWGIQNGTGFLIPTGSTYSKMMDVWKHDTEIVLKPNVYPNISLFRTTEMIEAGLHQLPVQYESKADEIRVSIVGSETCIRYSSMAMPRVSSKAGATT